MPSQKMQNGDCLKVACNNCVDFGWLFCYAYVLGQKELSGKRILHAWNEINNNVIDYSNRHKIIAKKEVYYALAQIKESDVVKQQRPEVCKLMVKTGTYGGWIK